MPTLVIPDPNWASSFRAALIEAAERGEALPWDPAVDCSEDDLRERIYDLARGARGLGQSEPNEYHRWWVDGDTYLGRSSLRFPEVRLRESFYASHGDIGYDVRPSARGRGHATAMLHAMLDLAKSEGYADVLITCDVDNVPSRRVLEKAGGTFLDRYEDEKETVLRYRFTL